MTFKVPHIMKAFVAVLGIASLCLLLSCHNGKSAGTWVGSSPEDLGENDGVILGISLKDVHIGRPQQHHVTVFGSSGAVRYRATGLPAAGIEIAVENITRRGETGTLEIYTTTECGGFNLRQGEAAEVWNIRAESGDAIEVRAKGVSARKFVAELFTRPIARDNTHAIVFEQPSIVWLGTAVGAYRCVDPQVENGALICEEAIHFTTENTNGGLPANQITSVTREGSDTFWFGTSGGVGRYRAGTWTPFTTDNGLVHNDVKALAVAENGNLWAATAGGVSRRSVDGTWTPFEMVGCNPVNTIAIGTGGDVWAGTQCGISLYHQGEWSKPVIPGPDPTITIYNVPALAVSDSGALWFVTVGGVVRYENGISTPVLVDNEMPRRYLFTSIGLRKNGEVWVGTFAGEVLVYQGEVWTNVADGLNKLGGGGVFSIAFGEADDVWVGTVNGTGRYLDGEWRFFEKQNGLIHPIVLSIAAGSQGDIWFGTAAGVSHYQDAAWTTFTPEDGLFDQEVRTIAIAGQNDIWFGTRNGLSHYQNGLWTPFGASSEEQALLSGARSILVEPNGDVWAGSDLGLSRYRNNHWETLPPSDGFPWGAVYAIARDASGDLWFGGVSGLTRYHDGVPTLVPTDSIVLALAVGQNNEIWFGTYRGLGRYKDTTVTMYTIADGLADDYIAALATGKDGALWIATPKGLSRYLNGEWMTLATLDGLPSNNVLSLAIGADGSLWAGTQFGATHFLKTDGELVFNPTIIP